MKVFKTVKMEIETDVDSFNILCDLLIDAAKTKPKKFININELELQINEQNGLNMYFCPNKT